MDKKAQINLIFSATVVQPTVHIDDIPECTTVQSGLTKPMSQAQQVPRHPRCFTVVALTDYTRLDRAVTRTSCPKLLGTGISFGVTGPHRLGDVRAKPCQAVIALTSTTCAATTGGTSGYQVKPTAPPTQFRLSNLQRMQHMPSLAVRQPPSPVHQADRSSPPSQHALPKRAARKTNRRRTAMSTVTATTTSALHPGAMQALVQFRSSSLRRMQCTPSSIGNRASSSVHQADRSPHQVTS